ncbi:helix-turn-helix domain-containing protein [Nocardia sp. NPDC020380]|uniref:helix-turn-helix domain-containing protein n=1 Tax=Nocardia sp. NPDC020380 TaxID=3364309 RepID=UPI00379549FB
MQLRYNFRICPTPGQEIALARAFGCARVVFNDALKARQDARAAGLPYISDSALSRSLTKAKKTPERVWLADVSAVVLQQALADLNTAYSLTNSTVPSSICGHEFTAGCPHHIRRTGCISHEDIVECGLVSLELPLG